MTRTDMTRTVALVACIAVAALALHAGAAGAAPYGWAGGSYAFVEAPDFTGDRFNDGSFMPSQTTQDTEDGGFRVFGGYGLSRYLGLELGYVDFGQATFQASSDGSGFYAAGPVAGEVASDGFDLALRGRIPTGSAAYIVPRVGAVRWDGEMEVRDATGTVRSATRSGTDFVYGVGLEIEIPRLALVIDYRK
jgi:OmpA-OmpF porin, OOP family